MEAEWLLHPPDEDVVAVTQVQIMSDISLLHPKLDAQNLLSVLIWFATHSRGWPIRCK